MSISAFRAIGIPYGKIIHPKSRKVFRFYVQRNVKGTQEVALNPSSPINTQERTIPRLVLYPAGRLAGQARTVRSVNPQTAFVLQPTGTWKGSARNGTAGGFTEPILRSGGFPETHHAH